MSVKTPALAGMIGAASDASVTVLNQRLATLVAGEQAPARRFGARAAGIGPRFAPVAKAPTIRLAPFLIELAGRYNRAEHILHFQSHGFDANFWGLVGGGRVRLHYSVKF